MTSLFRWIAGRDERPPATIDPSHGNSRASAVVVRRDDNSLRSITRAPLNPNSVTYASKDDKRNVQFVCHLPTGSEHAEQAQKIAAAMYSGRPADTSSRGEKLLGGSNSGLFLEDAGSRMRRERAEVERVVAEERRRSGTSSTARSVTSSASVRRAPTVVDDYESPDDDEGPESVPPRSYRSTTSASTKYYTSDAGHTIVEIEPSDVGDRDDDYHRRATRTTTTSSRHPVPASVRAASVAMTSAAGNNTSSSGIIRTTSTRKSQPSGFRHQSETHTTYNITNKASGRQLFVSAPVGSREAEIHDLVAAKAATGSGGTSKSSWIEDGGSDRGVVSRSRWVGD